MAADRNSRPTPRLAPALLSAALVGLPLIASSCSSEGDVEPPASVDRPLVQRIEWRLASPRELPEIATYRLLDPPDGWVREESTGGWEVDLQTKLADVTDVPRDPKTWKPKDPPRAIVLRGKTAKSLSIHGEFDAAEFNGVVVVLRGGKEQSVQVRCLREGKPVATSEAFNIPETEGQPVANMMFELPNLQRVEKPVDEVQLRFPTPQGQVAVMRVDLVRSPFARFLALPEEGAGLAEIGTNSRELRRGVGLSSQAPLVAEFDVPEAAELAFTWGVPEAIRTPRAKPRLVLELEAEGVPTLAHSIDVESPGAQREKPQWHAETLDLAAFAGKRVRARARLDVAEGYAREALVHLAEARVRVRGRQPQSVLLISSDTHRGDHLGKTRPPGATESRVRTPVLDALATRGVLFTNCFSATNVTNPSHIALMTARHVRDTGIVNNHTRLVDSVTTLAECFQDQGYRTFAALSANHLIDDESGLGQGFDRMSSPRAADRDAEETIDRLVNWLDQSEGEPVFVWLHLFDAHAPYGPPAEFDRRYYPKDRDPYDKSRTAPLPKIEFPAFMVGVTDMEYPYQQYRAEIDYLDRELGRVLDMDRFRAGIVGFTADHGESFGEHGIWWDHAELYPTSVHVPMVLGFPGAPASTECDAPVRQIDLGRTLLNLAGLESVDFPGRDLRWGLDTPELTEPRYMISAHGSSAAIQSGRWHLLLTLRKGGSSWAVEEKREAHSVELYDLEADPGCTKNLVDEEFERASRMRAELLRWLAEAPETKLGEAGGPMKTAAQENLKALGYGGGGEDEPVTSSTWYTPDPDSPWVRRFEGN